MSCRVLFIADAEKDLIDIFKYIKNSGYPENAKNLISRIRKACSGLSGLPDRRRIVPELRRIGIFDYRELIIKPYRIIYETKDKTVYIHFILDAGRDIQTVLLDRLLR